MPRRQKTLSPSRWLRRPLSAPFPGAPHWRRPPVRRRGCTRRRPLPPRRHRCRRRRRPGRLDLHVISAPVLRIDTLEDQARLADTLDALPPPLLILDPLVSDWPTIFPNATCATVLIDRTVHHADVIAIDGESFRRREAEADKKTRRGKKAA
jgi:hypothetical protein